MRFVGLDNITDRRRRHRAGCRQNATNGRAWLLQQAYPPIASGEPQWECRYNITPSGDATSPVPAYWLADVRSPMGTIGADSVAPSIRLANPHLRSSSLD